MEGQKEIDIPTDCGAAEERHDDEIPVSTLPNKRVEKQEEAIDLPHAESMQDHI